MGFVNYMPWAVVHCMAFGARLLLHSAWVFWSYDEIFTTQWYCGISLLASCTMCSSWNIRLFENMDLLSARNFCPLLSLCAGMFLKDYHLHLWLWKLHCNIICDMIYVDIIQHWTCFSSDVCTIGFYMMSIIFIDHALPELDILCASVLYFYVMSWYSPTTHSPGTLYSCVSCCIFLYDVNDIHLLRALQELDIKCASVLCTSLWCHWSWSTVSSHHQSRCREKYTSYWCCSYMSTVCSTSLCIIMLSDGAYFRKFHTECCIYFDEHGAESLWWLPSVGWLYLNVNMSERQRKLNEKGLGPIENNLPAKCASAIWVANKVVNKPIPLLKSDNSDLEPVKEYSVELYQYITLIVDTHEEFDNKFTGHLEILAGFVEWLQLLFDVLKSVLEYNPLPQLPVLHTCLRFHRVLVYCPIKITLSQKTVFHSCFLLVLALTDIVTCPVSQDLASVNLLHQVMLVQSNRLVKKSLQKVTLMVEARNLVEKQILLRKEFELSMEKQSLDHLSTNLAITTAKEEILLNAELNHDSVSVLHVSGVIARPVGTGPSVCLSVKPDGLLSDDLSVHLSTKVMNNWPRFSGWVPRWYSGFQVCRQGTRWLCHWCWFKEWDQSWVCLW